MLSHRSVSDSSPGGLAAAGGVAVVATIHTQRVLILAEAALRSATVDDAGLREAGAKALC